MSETKIKESLLAYTAGIIDGEGCIGVYRKKSGKYLRYQLHLSVKMADKKVINLLKSLYGGSITITKIVGNRKQTYAWQVSCIKAINCLDKILPYLITKQTNAALAIQFQRNLVNKSNRLHSLSKDMENARDKIIQEFRLLNKRGKE